MMIIIDSRIENKWYVLLDTTNCVIHKAVLEEWLSPYFSVQAENTESFRIISKIVLFKGMQDDYIYLDNIFYINADLSYNMLLYTLTCILRIIFKYAACIEGYINLHAACLKYKNMGILIIADRNQGKTTMLLNAIQDNEFSLLANDQVMYNINNNLLLGYPAVVGVRDNSCNNVRLEQIKARALWFTDDQFQTQPKPAILIKDLSRIFQCEVVASASLKVIIHYQKSQQIDELNVKDIGKREFYLDMIELPFESIYKEKLIYACKCSINYYTGSIINRDLNNKCLDSVKQIQITCGIARIRDMLYEIKSLLENGCDTKCPILLKD